MAKKMIVVVGWSLIGFIAVVFAAIMLIAIFSGGDVAPLKLIPGSRGGSQFAVATVPLLVGLLVVLFFWLRRVFRRRTLISSLNKALRPNTQKQRTG